MQLYMAKSRINQIHMTVFHKSDRHPVGSPPVDSPTWLRAWRLLSRVYTHGAQPTRKDTRYGSTNDPSTGQSDRGAQHTRSIPGGGFHPQDPSNMLQNSWRTYPQAHQNGAEHSSILAKPGVLPIHQPTTKLSWKVVSGYTMMRV
jgi:hypothetical protein